MFLLLYPTVLLTLRPLLSLAQDYSIPSQWVGTSSSLIRSDRIQLAQNVLHTLADGYNSTTGELPTIYFGQNANLFTATVMNDLLTAHSNNLDTSRQHLSRIMPTVAPETTSDVSNDPLMWGLAAIYAYQAYQDRSFLDNAITIWQTYNPWMITSVQAEQGSHPLKNGKFPSQCNGSSNAGGVFYFIQDNKKSDFHITAGTQGAYMGLSAYLFDITDNQTYREATQLSLSFIQSHLYDSSRSYIMDIFDPVKCEFPTNDIWTANSGLYLQALSVWAYKSDNSALVQEADQLALNSIKSSNWTGKNGVVIEHPRQVDQKDASAAYKGMLMRGLYEHWSRSQADSQIAKLIETFLMVQYNNLLNNVRYPGTDFYSPSWLGPPVMSLLPWGQLSAIDVLNSAIGLTAHPNPSSVSESAAPTVTNTYTPTMESTHRHIVLGAIIGGAIGGCVFVLVILLLSYRYWKCNCIITRRHLDSTGYKRRPSRQDVGNVLENVVQPFPSLVSENERSLFLRGSSVDVLLFLRAL
ncbi:hypothetical protein QCA50_008113 [Cerrena zonata]|uniref:Glycoside hydrolase family 76 protein n=1 Tax=Cerrena zonata TaxID=2478898 RepID=A0AAW0G516_9APHY